MNILPFHFCRITDQQKMKLFNRYCSALKSPADWSVWRSVSSQHPSEQKCTDRKTPSND